MITDKKGKYRTADPAWYHLLKGFARENRKNPTLAEQRMWEYLKDAQLGTTFKRQHIIDDYIADFASLHFHLVIEIDGKYHTLPEQVVDDEVRTKMLAMWGYRVIRFTNDEVLCDIEKVIDKIKAELHN